MTMINKIRTIAFFAVMFIVIGFTSCSKANKEGANDTTKEPETVNVSNVDFSETDEDLLTVDY